MIPVREQNIGNDERCANPNGCISNESRCDLFRYMRWLLYITAIRPTPFEEFLPQRFHRYSVLLNLILDIFLDFMVLHMLVLFLCTIYFNYDNGDLEFLINVGIQTALYLWATIIKLVFRYVYPDLTNGILDYVNKEYIVHSAVGFSYVTMKACSEKVNSGIKIFAAGCISAVVFQLFLPIIYGSRTLPLVCWYPVDYKAPFIYEIAYIFQTVAQVQISTLFVVNSAYFLSLLLLTLRTIRYSELQFEEYSGNDLHLYGSRQKELRDKERMPNEEINEYYVTDELPFDLDCLPHIPNPAETSTPRSFREAFNYALKPCVEHHIFILNVLRKVQRLFNFIWMVKMVLITLFFCMAAFNIVKLSEGETFLKVFSIGHYLFLGLCDLFMTCYASEIIHICSQSCDEALLRSPWYLHLCEVRTDYLIFLTNSQQAFEFTAGNIYPLRLEKFRAIITTSFSYFTFLRSMDKGE